MVGSSHRSLAVFEALATAPSTASSWSDPSWGPWARLLDDSEATASANGESASEGESEDKRDGDGDGDGRVVQVLADGVRFGARGPLFGHLLLEGGSASLGREESRLVAGTPSPTIGALMRLRELRRLGDGRLAVHAIAVGRFRVLRGTQEGPYSRADVAVLPDQEEVTQWAPCAARFHAEGPTRLAGARAAAAAAALVWSEYEFAPPPAPTVGGPEGEKEGEGLEPEGLEYGLGELARFSVALDHAACAAEADAAGEAAAWLGGGPAAAAAFAELDELGGGGDGGGDGDGANPFSDPAWGPWGELLGDGDASDAAPPPPPPSGAPASASASTPTSTSSALSGAGSQSAAEDAEALVRLEQRVWGELVSCLRLSRSLKRSGDRPAVAEEQQEEEVQEVPLPAALRMLLPPEPPEGWPLGVPKGPPKGAEWLRDAYPPLRRAQRLSFLVPALMPELERQALLACGGVTERLEEELMQLSTARERLAALVALRGLQQ